MSIAEHDETPAHVPVLLHEVLEQLRAHDGGNFLDCTFGGGGHSRAILESNHANRVTAADRDVRAVERASKLVREYPERFSILHAKFSELSSLFGGSVFQGVLADLGTSTQQLFEARGFSFHDGDSLDMRMDETDDVTAREIVGSATHSQLLRILRRGGVGKEGSAIARAIISRRPISSGKELADVVTSALGRRFREKKGNPATLVFQALRIEVNDEYSELDALLKGVRELVGPGSRCCVISFHSEEDKRVAKCFRGWESPPFFALDPSSIQSNALGRQTTRKAITPTPEEQRTNPSARSARMRVFQFAD